LEFNVPFQHKYGYIRDEHLFVRIYITPLCKTTYAYAALYFTAIVRPRGQNCGLGLVTVASRLGLQQLTSFNVTGILRATDIL